MQINSVSNTNFGARFGGEIEKIIEISKNAGMSNRRIKKLLDDAHRVCPGPEYQVDFYFRKYHTLHKHEPRIRSGVKISKDGITKELNINPRNLKPDTLLAQMIEGIKDLALKRVHSNNKHHAYKISSPKSWLAKYQEQDYCYNKVL